MIRLYCPKELIRDREIAINQRSQVHYLCDVLRLGINDNIFIFDGEGNEYFCQIQEKTRNKLMLRIKGKTRLKSKARINLSIACALPKQKSRFDDLIDKLSQLGVDKVIPMVTERVIVRWGSAQKQRHQQRWRKIAQQACIQSGRSVLPAIEPVQEIHQILTQSQSYDLKLIPTLIERKQGLLDMISTVSAGKILILIGPEGDFSAQELSRAKSAGFIPVSLGPLVLRVDTAAIAITAFIKLLDF